MTNATKPVSVGPAPLTSANSMSNAGNFKAGDQLGRYELLFPVGKGGMGQVWAAKLRGSQGFRKLVALKTLLAGEAFSKEMQRMLRDEAMLASHIKSPHVAETLDFDLHQGVPYLVMEWVDGESLANLMDEVQGVMSLKHVVAIVTQALKGLDAAHRASDASGQPLGLVHRDVSPPNILVSYAGTVKLADFGIAKITNTEKLDADEGLKGKFNFMAPEQVHGERVDARTDIFAMSVLLYRLLTGRYPFAGSDPSDTLWQISSSITPRAPRALNENLPPRIEEIILKGLQKQPADRFQSARELLQALERSVPPTLRGKAEHIIAELMTSCMGERKEQRRRETARALLSVPPTAMDSLTAPVFSTLKGLTYTAPPEDSITLGADTKRRASRARVRWPMWALAGAIGAAMGSAALYAGFNVTREPGRSASSVAAPQEPRALGINSEPSSAATVDGETLNDEDPNDEVPNDEVPNDETEAASADSAIASATKPSASTPPVRTKRRNIPRTGAGRPSGSPRTRVGAATSPPAPTMDLKKPY